MIEDESDSTINEETSREQAGSSSPVRKKAKLDLSSLGDPESATQCPICLDSWSSSGSHRLVSLSCGHLFGQLCIEKWLSSHNKCPTCNGFAKKSDIRQLYTKAIWTVQDDERENALRLYESEKVKRSHLEKLHLKTSMQCQLYASENSMMRKKISELENQLKVNTQMHGKSLKQHGFYSFSRSVLVSTERKANVLHSDPHSGMIAVSKKLEDSPNKHGVLKLSSMEGSHHEFVNLHSDQIRDILFDPHGNTTLLSCSKSKEIKLTSLKSNNTVISYQAQRDCWSCGWSEGNMFHMLCGLQNGEVLLFDIRNTREVIESISPITSAQRCPVISIVSLPSPAQNGIEGLLISTLQCISFYKKGTDGKFTGTQLDTPTGALSMVSYESEQSQILASYKPGTRNPKERHVLMNFKVSASNVAQVDTVHTFEGGAAQHLRSRSCLIKCPDDDNHLLVCAGDQADTSVRIWSTKTLKQQQNWVCQKEDGPIIAMGPHRAAGIQYLCTLTNQRFNQYKWNFSKKFHEQFNNTV